MDGLTSVDQVIAEAEATLSADSEHRIGHYMVELNYAMATGHGGGIVALPEDEIPLFQEACRRLGLAVFDTGVELSIEGGI